MWLNLGFGNFDAVLARRLHGGNTRNRARAMFFFFFSSSKFFSSIDVLSRRRPDPFCAISPVFMYAIPTLIFYTWYRDRPPFFDGVLHGVLSNTRMPSDGPEIKKIDLRIWAIGNAGIPVFKRADLSFWRSRRQVCTGRIPI